jgi:hypothetical protein
MSNMITIFVEGGEYVDKAAYIKQRTRIAELEADRKRDCVDFFRWFWNQPGSNTEQGYDSWLDSKELT